MKKATTNPALLALPLAAALLAGCSGGGESSGSGAGDDSAAPNGDAPSSAEHKESGGTLEQAQAAMKSAQQKVDGQVVELDFDEGQWKVDVYASGKTTEVAVDGAGSKATKGASESADADDRANYETVKITMAQALKNALHHQAGSIDEAAIDRAQGQVNYEVEIIPPNGGAAKTVHVGYRNGDILKDVKDD